MKTTVTTIFFALAFIALSHIAHAVVPPPDGGYPGGNTAEGQSALFSRTSGGYNTANGWNSLFRLSTGSFNTGIGAATLFSNTADQNTATGAAALFSNTTGFGNTANGAFALLGNTEGFGNTATGLSALNLNTTGSDNTAIGTFALLNNTEGSSNTAVGRDALESNTADNNTAIGRSALGSNTTGTQNTAAGVLALLSNTTGNYNTATGVGALHQNSTGSNNTANGINALYNNTADNNTAFGANALISNTNGSNNTAIGIDALHSNRTHPGNTAVGYQSLYNLNDGSYNVAVAGGGNLHGGDYNIYIGNDGPPPQFGRENGVIRIGSTCCQSQTYIAGIHGVTIPDGAIVYVNSGGQLGTLTSSIRFKDEVQPMDKASEAILALRPVSFRYKKEFDPNGIPQFGLVAEEVEKVNPDLVLHDANGDPYSVRYEQINAMLLNEFLKEHKTVQELKKEIAGLVAIVREQDSKIQRINDQLETTPSLPQLADNNR